MKKLLHENMDLKAENARLNEVAAKNELERINAAAQERIVEEGSVAKQNTQLEMYKKQLVALKREISSFYEFRMPFNLETDELKSIANDRFPEGLL